MFSFKYITRLSAPAKIVKEIYNLYFGTFIIKSTIDDKKNATYEINELVYDYYNF